MLKRQCRSNAVFQYFGTFQNRFLNTVCNVFEQRLFPMSKQSWGNSELLYLKNNLELKSNVYISRSSFNVPDVGETSMKYSRQVSLFQISHHKLHLYNVLIVFSVFYTICIWYFIEYNVWTVSVVSYIVNVLYTGNLNAKFCTLKI